MDDSVDRLSDDAMWCRTKNQKKMKKKMKIGFLMNVSRVAQEAENQLIKVTAWMGAEADLCHDTLYIVILYAIH